MTTQDVSILGVFEHFHNQLAIEHDKREGIRAIVKDLDQVVRQLTATLQTVHKPNGLSEVETLTTQVKGLLDTQTKDIHQQLYCAVDQSEFYRYHDHWKFSAQKLVFIVSFTEFLSSGDLLSWQDAAQRLHLSTDRASDGKKMLYLDLEDYLHGLLLLSNELSRLAVNSVTSANYEMPLKIASFMNNLESGFRLLNLKNDSLRKRFDSLKYDLKKVEEVVYDISIRGLLAKHGASTSAR